MSTPAGPPQILLLVQHKGNQRRLREWARETLGAALVAHTASERERFDLVVADPAGFVQERATIDRLRDQARPVFLPCLLVCAPREAERLTADIWRTVDDTVITPIRPDELRLRVDRLLDQRNQTALADHERTELRRSNVDLERFAFVVAHELIAPLAIVSAAVQTVAARFDAEHPDAQSELDAALEGCVRMQKLIDDILDLSRAGRGGEEGTVDTQALLQDVCHELRDRVATTGSTVGYDGLPTVTADSSQLRLVFRNLIVNAIKFRRPGFPAHIEITASPDDERWRFQISDDGVGIDPSERELVFDLFARSDTHDGVPGSGIGLATCRRVIERHGGRIWIEPGERHGTVVSFTLPFALPESDAADA